MKRNWTRGAKKTLVGSAKTFAENLKHYRNRAGFSQVEVAQRFNIAVTTVSGWETGKQPQFNQIDALAELYGVNSQDFFVSRDVPKKITIETDSDFAECIWALVRSDYVNKAELLRSVDKDGRADTRIELEWSSVKPEQREEASMLDELRAIFEMHKLGRAGLVSSDMVDFAVRNILNCMRD